MIGAKNLIKADISLLGKGKSDPFVRIKGRRGCSSWRIGEHLCLSLWIAQGNSEFRTRTIDNTTDPEWNEVSLCSPLWTGVERMISKVFEFVVEQYESDSIEFEVYDEDPGKDDFIGR